MLYATCKWRGYSKLTRDYSTEQYVTNFIRTQIYVYSICLCLSWYMSTCNINILKITIQNNSTTCTSIILNTVIIFIYIHRSSILFFQILLMDRVFCILDAILHFIPSFFTPNLLKCLKK